ncbi:hypothetical protein [Phenylobacterium sp.]|uniref:hypothetical protein n=1 Tax=Phenylobacterium sp. TaxID=1871053 RepID=UPI002737D890|nr:hypothetical protein [Phenylobacterium sp.]MDP3869147.1 hypothetical protein [Phenylobacterium sp.]
MSAQLLQFPPRVSRALPIDMAARIAMDASEQAAWAKTPQGRLLASLRAIEACGYGHTAERAIAAYRASMVEGATDPAAIGAAIIELLSIPDGDAVAREHVRAGCQALAEMLGANTQPNGAA